MKSNAVLERIKSEKYKFLNSRKEELKYMFRQPLPCLAGASRLRESLP